MLADSAWLVRYYHQQSAYEGYKTRLVRVDLFPGRGASDPILRLVRRFTRYIWFKCRRGGQREVDSESLQDAPEAVVDARLRAASQNTSWIADKIARCIVAFLIAGIITAALITLNRVKESKFQNMIIALFMLVFAFAMALLARPSTYQIMAGCAGFAAVLAVFVAT